jgi:excisionase family DNA binding protein
MAGTGPGTWVGRGAAGFRLDGEVNNAELSLTLQGIHPHSQGNLIGALGSAHRTRGQLQWSTLNGRRSATVVLPSRLSPVLACLWPNSALEVPNHQPWGSRGTAAFCGDPSPHLGCLFIGKSMGHPDPHYGSVQAMSRQFVAMPGPIQTWRKDMTEYPTAPPTVERLLDLIGAAAYLNDSPRHVRTLWERRELAAVRVGRKVRFDPKDLDRYIDAQRVHAIR